MARNTAEDRRSLTLSFQNTSTKIKLYNRKPFKLPDEGVLLCFCILLSEKKKSHGKKKYIKPHLERFTNYPFFRHNTCMYTLIIYK